MKRADIFFVLGRILFDMLAIFGALNLSYFLRMKWFEFKNPFTDQLVQLFVAPSTFFPYESFISSFSLKFTAIIIIIFAVHGRYKFREDEKVFDEIRHVFWAFSAGIALLLVYFFFAKFDFFSRLILGMTWGFSLFFIICGRILLRVFRRILYKYNRGRTDLLILGTGKLAAEMLPILLKMPRFNIIGILSTQTPVIILIFGKFNLTDETQFIYSIVVTDGLFSNTVPFCGFNE